MFSFRNIRTSQITIISGNSILESAMGPFISKLSFVQSVISFITGIVQTFLDGEQMRCHRQGFPLFSKLVLCYPLVSLCPYRATISEYIWSRKTRAGCMCALRACWLNVPWILTKSAPVNHRTAHCDFVPWHLTGPHTKTNHYLSYLSTWVLIVWCSYL